MDPLVHRLKELDPITFQELCFQLMAEKYPTAKIRYVQGASGDEGLDMFQGDLEFGPTVWQCKSFLVTTIGDSQKTQIRKSLRDAIASCSPREWILCINMDFDTKAHRWFQRLQKTYTSKGVQIDLVQGSKIVRELIFRHTLRDHYFPNAAILDEVRKLIPRPTTLTEQDLEQTPGETVEDYIERLREKDPRFNYEICISGDRGPSAFPPAPEPGIVAAFTDGRRTIKAFARDPEALLRDPIRFSATFTGTGIEKILSAIRTGKPQHFDSSEIKEFESSLPLLPVGGFRAGEFDLKLFPGSVNGSVPLRVSFLGKQPVIYELMEFETTRAGTDEVEISTKKAGLPFELRFEFPTPATQRTQFHMNLRKRFVGSEATQAWKAIKAFRILAAGCEIELYSLQYEKRLGLLTVPPMELDIPDGFSSLVERIARISEHFGVSIRLPDPGLFGEGDFHSVNLLYALASGEGLSLEKMEMNLLKSEQNNVTFPNALRNPVRFTVVHNDLTVQVLGTEVRAGSCAILFDKAEFTDPEQTLADFTKARIGESVPLSLKALSPVRVVSVASQGEPAKKS